MHIYCLFCLVSHVPVIRKLLDHTFSCEVLQASILQRKWIKGTPTDEPHDYLPGYLFIYSEEPITDMYRILNLDGVIRFLKYESTSDYELQGTYRFFAESLYKENGRISYVPVYEVGERLVIKDGLFQNQQAEIKKVDRRKQRLLLEFNFDNTTRTIWLGYDVVKEDIKLNEI